MVGIPGQSPASATYPANLLVLQQQWSVIANSSPVPHERVRDIASTWIDGRRAVVTIAGRSLGIWDAETGERLSSPGAGQTDESLTHMAVADLGGDPVAVTGSFEGAIRVWDLRSCGTPATPLQQLPNRILTLDALEVDGFVQIVCAQAPDPTSNVWSGVSGGQTVETFDAGSGARIRAYGYDGYIGRVTVGTTGGRCLGVVGYNAYWGPSPMVDQGDPMPCLTAWDLRTGKALGGAIAEDVTGSRALLIGELDQRPVVFAAAFSELQVWDLTLGRRLAHFRWPGLIETLRHAGWNGRPVLAIGGTVLDSGHRRPWLWIWDPHEQLLLAEAALNGDESAGFAALPDGALVVASAKRARRLRPASLTASEEPVHLAIAAARSGDLITLHALLDWHVSAAAIVADLSPVSPERRRSDLASGLGSLDLAAAGDLEIMGKVVQPLAGWLANATGVRRADPEVRDAYLAALRLPGSFAEFATGLTPTQLDRLGILRDMAAQLSEVYVIATPDGELTVVVSPGGRLVIHPDALPGS